ncbi:MAG: MFS transporter, partial [Anaerolineales bacterium]|nr:MFS transporter [Anaerolineales bacterium]
MPRSVALILHRAKELEQWKKTLYIVFFAQLMSTVGFSTIFPFLPLYVAELGSKSGLSIELLSGLVFSAQAFTMMLAAPFWGSMADRHGRKMMIQRATFGGAITVFAMGFATSAEMLVGIRTIQGIVTGTVTAANALIAATVPREKIGYAMGLMQVGLWGGVAVGPLMGGALADAFGYRLSFVITGVLLFLAGILVWWGVHENFVPKPADPNKKKPSMLASWRAVIVTKGVPAIFFFRFMNGLGRMLVYPILPLFIATLLPATAPHNFYTGLITGVYGAASTVTAVLLGKLGDRIGHRQILMACTLVAALTYIPQMWVTAAW